MKTDLEKPLAIKIKKLNINEAYFLGEAEIDGKEYRINVQGHWKEKLIKIPVRYPQKEKVLIRLTGKKDTMIEDIVAYKGKSEWIEIDSSKILYYLADNQDKIDTLEVYL